LPEPGLITPVATRPDPALDRRPTTVAGIASVGGAVPARSVASGEIAAGLDVDADWIVARTGVRERRVAAADESLVDLAARAGTTALGLGGIDPGAVDLVLVATFTADDLQPHAAPLVAGAVGAHRAGAIDVGAACTGFLSALSLAAGQVQAGLAECVLVFGADLVSRVVDYDDRSTAGLFGDGAGAAVVTAGGPGSIGPIELRADASGASLITATHLERKLRMDGRPTFRRAVAAMSEITLEVTDRAGLTTDDVDLFVFHQANRRILAAVAERLGLAGERVVDCMERYGNTSAASIPIALAEADKDGRLAPGTRVLVAAFGAGLTWGGGLVEWGGDG
jgi:3-oxoacyl-[acyl-carrier-protein] synthase III